MGLTVSEIQHGVWGFKRCHVPLFSERSHSWRDQWLHVSPVLWFLPIFPLPKRANEVKLFCLLRISISIYKKVLYFLCLGYNPVYTCQLAVNGMAAQFRGCGFSPAWKRWSIDWTRTSRIWVNNVLVSNPLKYLDYIFDLMTSLSKVEL